MGLRGAGKTSLGKALAEAHAMPFADLDEWSAHAAGFPTPGEAITRLGEPAFRRAEAASLRVALLYRGHVFALGGGTPTAPEAERLIRDARTARHVRVIYLRARPETLHARLARTNLAERPTLTGAGTLEEIAVLFERRDALYRSLAEVVIDTDELTFDRVLSALKVACADLAKKGPQEQPGNAR